MSEIAILSPHRKLRHDGPPHTTQQLSASAADVKVAGCLRYVHDQAASRRLIENPQRPKEEVGEPGSGFRSTIGPVSLSFSSKFHRSTPGVVLFVCSDPCWPNLYELYSRLLFR